MKEIPKPNRHVFKAAFHLLGQKYPDSIYLHHLQSHQNRVTQFSILHVHTPQCLGAKKKKKKKKRKEQYFFWTFLGLMSILKMPYCDFQRNWRESTESSTFLQSYGDSHEITGTSSFYVFHFRCLLNEAGTLNAKYISVPPCNEWSLCTKCLRQF